MTLVVNKHTHELAPGDVYIGRGSKWGNPFKIGEDGTREEVIAKYRVRLWAQIQNEEIALEDLAALEGKTLVCFCKPQACHGDVLARAAEWAADELGPYYTPKTGTLCPMCGADPCYLQCPNNPHYLTAEREKEDALFEDSLPYDIWKREAIAQYERVHGEPYVS